MFYEETKIPIYFTIPKIPFPLDASNFFTIISLEKGGISIEDIKLDFSLKTIEERNQFISDLLSKHPDQKFTPRQLEYFGDYIIGALSKEEKKEKTILTENRLVTINKRETSYEGLVSKFENGEDGLSNLITNDKNILLVPKISITDADLAEVPGLAALREAIEAVEAECATATGRRKYLLKKQLIEMRRDQYILKNDYRSPVRLATTGGRGGLNKIDLAEKIFINTAGDPQSSGLVSLFNPEHVSAILRNYLALKVETAAKFQSDFYYLMIDFDNLLRKTIQYQYPMYYDIFLWKTKDKTNAEIQTLLLEKYEQKYSIEHISSLWRNKIPKLLAE